MLMGETCLSLKKKKIDIVYFLLFLTRNGWWVRRVSVVRGWASKPGGAHDGRGSWCLRAGHGHRLGLSCPAIRT